jgi:hypothetical protein
MPRPRHASLLPLLAVAAVTQAGTDDAINACTLLQPAEIARLLGRGIDAGRRMDSGAGTNGAYSSSCVWMLAPIAGEHADPRAALGGRSFVMLNAMQWPAGSGQAHTFLDSFREAKASGVLTSPLSPRRFGDEAFFWGDGLAVRSRDIAFGLSVHVTGEQHTEVVTEKLVAQVLRRIETRDAQLGRLVKP